MKKKPGLNTGGSSARLLEEVLAIEKDSENQLANCTKVRDRKPLRVDITVLVSYFVLLFFVLCLLLQYYYSVKILHGQNPSCVWVGWVTSNFHCYDKSFDLEKMCSVTVTLGDQWGKVLERLMTSSLYL